MKKILFIEEDPSPRDIIVNRLGEIGHQVVVAESGYDGIKLLESQKFDLVILDIMLPHGDFEVVPREIKKRQVGIHILEKLIDGAFEVKGTGRNVPVLVLSAIVDTRDIQLIRERLRSSNFYFGKPMRPTEIVNRVKSILQGDE